MGTSKHKVVTCWGECWIAIASGHGGNGALQFHRFDWTKTYVENMMRRSAHPATNMATEFDRPRLVIFDFDGTLADSFPFFLRTFDILAERHGFRPIGGDNLHALRACDARQIMRHVGIPLWKAPRVASDFRNMMADEIEGIGLFDGVGAMLQALAGESVRLAVLSSNSEANVRAVLGREHARRIETYACGASLFGKRSKLRRLLAAMGVERRHALCIGDELRDAEAARDERLRFGAVAWGYTRADVLAAARPDYLFRRVDEIAPALFAKPRLRPQDHHLGLA